MDNDQAAALLGRAMAQGTAIEVLMALYLADRPAPERVVAFEMLRDASADTGPKAGMSDEAAVFMSDARLHAMAATDALIARTQALLAGMIDDEREPSPVR